MTKIRIERGNDWLNRARKIGIYLDDEKLGTISRNDTKEYNITPGQHELRAKIDWCGSKDYNFSINENDSKIFMINGFKNSKFYALACLFIFPIVFISNSLLDNEVQLLDGFGVGLCMGVFSVLVYYLTLGRNSFLVIEDKTLL